MFEANFELVSVPRLFAYGFLSQLLRSLKGNNSHGPGLLYIMQQRLHTIATSAIMRI